MMRVLIADDDEVSRFLLEAMLKDWGYDCLVAGDGLEAWQRLCTEDIQFVISDLMMPHMDGIELCRRIRNANWPYYVYVILLTASYEKSALITGMEAGADDFLNKPFDQEELQVRIRAGERVVRLEQTLHQRNVALSAAYSQIQRDLEAAARMQQSLLPRAAVTLSGITCDWVFHPCAVVAGDIFNVFPLDEQHLGFYHLDVAGHGIPSAMLSVTLSKVLSATDAQHSLLKRYRAEAAQPDLLSPADVIRTLNQQFQSSDDSLLYFTMVYGLIDTQAARMTLTQAGHPSPVYLPKGGPAVLLGTGGYPVGMLPGVDYETVTVDFQCGDRLVLYSDGVTECQNATHEGFTERRLLRYLEQTRTQPLAQVMQNLERYLCVWRGAPAFEDDVSVLAFEASGEERVR